jgi:hypothetical protein
MRKLSILLSLVIFFINSNASDHGIYLHTVSNIQGDMDNVKSSLLKTLSSSEFKVVAALDIKTPDYVRENSSEYCGYSAYLIVLTSDTYTKLITSHGTKYLIAGFLRIGVYETPGGIQINLANPETINRIIFNDLEDEDQFPLIYSTKTENGKADIQKVFSGMMENLKKFVPDEDDIDYRWTPDKSDLNWKIISDLYSPDSTALMIGITRPRTEAVSFYIAGKSREEDNNYCPGIDHVTAYPIEVLIIHEEDNINVYSAREMFRMDMYFWDAGKFAFMDHMQMPGMLDDSIKRAFFGPEEE